MACCDNDEILHNGLGGLQGGVTNERYHLTKDQWHAVVTGGGGGGSSYTFENGLIADEDVVKLGGYIEASTNIGLAASLTIGNEDINMVFGTSPVEIAFHVGSAKPATLQFLNGQIILGTPTRSITLTDNEDQMVITDNSANQGFVNAGDYENNFVNRSLVTKQYVDGLAAPKTFTGGLLDDSNVVRLGGPLSAITTLTGYNANHLILINDNNYTSTFHNVARIGLESGQLNLSLSDNISGSVLTTSLRFGFGGTVFVDEINSSGIYYGGDYEPNFQAKSLVSRQYVDDAVIANTNVFFDGITQSGNEVKLGGSMTNSTTIDISEAYITLSGSVNADTVHKGAYKYFNMDSNYCNISYYDEASGPADQTTISQQGGSLLFRLQSTVSETKENSIEINTLGITVQNATTNNGITYDIQPTAYSALSLVTKQYVDAAIAAAIAAI